MNSYQEKNDFLEKSEFQENLSFLRQIYFFSELPLEVLKVLAYLCTREDYRNGDSIFTQGDDDGCAYYLLSGQAQLSRNRKNNEVFIRSCDEGSFLGAFILTSKMNRLFSLTALTDTRCLVLARENFLDTISQFPDISQNIIQALSDNIYSWEEKFLHDHLDCDSCRSIMGASLL